LDGRESLLWIRVNWHVGLFWKAKPFPTSAEPLTFTLQRFTDSLLCGQRAWVPLDVSGNGDRLDGFEVLEAGLVTPTEKLIDGSVISLAGIWLADRAREELGKLPDSRRASVGQD
jgi:hypothetical protein